MIRGAALALLLPWCAQAAAPAERPGRPQLGEPVTAVSIDIDLRDIPVAPAWKPGQPIREAHKRQYYPPGTVFPHAPASKPTATDHLSELQQIWDENAPHALRRSGLRSRVNINNPNTGVSPGDPVVEVGTGHVLYGVNASGGTLFTVYDKAGTLLAGPITFRSLATPGDSCATSVGDPIILFDRLASRWFMLEIGSSNRICTYVSKTSDPVTGGWWFYSFTAPSLPDYPHCGVWNDAYVCTTNEGGANVTAYALDRANMLNGATARATQRFVTVPALAGYGFQALTPATFVGSTAPPSGSSQILARHNDDEAHAGAGADGSKDFIDLYSINIDWTTPANSAITTLPRIDITEFNSWIRNYSSFAVVPQPGSTSRLDPIREVILNSLVYRNTGTHESIVGNFVTNQDPARSGTVVDAGIRWFELRRTGGNWSLHQEGTFSPGDASTHHLLGAIASDKNGNIALGYNVTKTSAPTIFATLRYSGRTPGTPLGVMSLAETDIAAGAAVETSGRWGDYYQMAVDPVDDCTFWFVGMYRPAGSWNTSIQDFKFPDCTLAASTYSVSGTITTSTGVGINGVTVGNGTLSTTTNSSGVYTLANLANGNHTITPSRIGFNFSPASRNVSISGADVTGQDFTGTYDARPDITTLRGRVVAANLTDTRVRNSLLAPLDAALTWLNGSDPNRVQYACSNLAKFIATVRQNIQFGKLPAATGNPWITEANSILSQSGCPTR